MQTHTSCSMVAHSQAYQQPTVETDRHPRCITLLFVSWICHRPGTTGQHLARVTNLHSAHCPGWLRTPRLFNFRCDSVIAEASCYWNGDKLHKETQTELEREQLRWGEVGFLFILNSLKLLQTLKDDCRHSDTSNLLHLCAYARLVLSFCVFVYFLGILEGQQRWRLWAWHRGWPNSAWPRNPHLV